jgi:hypothetical protein
MGQPVRLGLLRRKLTDIGRGDYKEPCPIECLGIPLAAANLKAARRDKARLAGAHGRPRAGTENRGRRARSPRFCTIINQHRVQPVEGNP